ncbi:hypothetical protein NC651_005438 [Populus alba x Populus x berolinensis]|nr:hypothetical protein NC651_005438 [Populus alba x Populus x berolinensis]
MTEPSKVIHVRNVGHEISENDLLQLFQPFGVITKLVMLRAKNQALLQMQDVPSAINALQLYTNIQPTIRGRNVYVQFSSHQELTTMDQNTQGRGDEPNRILLVTIHHMLYPITVEVLHQVFSPHGFVEKIVTFQKSAGFQALIQYQSRQCAVQARTSLQGRNIYDGCCQLDIQFSKYEKGSDEISLKAMGRAINKTVMIAELIKRRIAGLHQNTSIGSNDITDMWEPLEEGLLPLETTRHVSVITVTLSKKELDTSSTGYQSPIPADQVKPLAEYDYEGEGGSPRRQGRGRGGRGIARGRGNNSNGVVEHNGDGDRVGGRGYGGRDEDGVIVAVEEVMVVDICNNSQVVIMTMVVEHLLAKAVLHIFLSFALNHGILPQFYCMGEDGAGVVGVAGVSDRTVQPSQLSEP